jgi:hypothetical protein
MNPTIAHRLEKLDWPSIQQSLNDRGYALTPALLTELECNDLRETYPADQPFRSHIIMSRYRFGRGDYKYFVYPLPAVVEELREASYSYLAPVANEWNENLGIAEKFLAAIPPFLPPARRSGRCALRRYCGITKPATSTACIRTSTVRLHPRCN